MEDNDNVESCCVPFVEENSTLKKLKPVLIGGIIFYSIILILDIILLMNKIFFDYCLLILCLSLMIFNRCYIAFYYYTLLSIIIIFSNIIPSIGIIIQTHFKNKGDIIRFIIFFFILAFSIVFFYFGFLAYKEMKYLFMNRIVNNQPYVGIINDDEENNKNKNSNNDKNKEKYFTGKGYVVGGS